MMLIACDPLSSFEAPTEEDVLLVWRRRSFVRQAVDRLRSPFDAACEGMLAHEDGAEWAHRALVDHPLGCPPIGVRVSLVESRRVLCDKFVLSGHTLQTATFDVTAETPAREAPRTS